MSPADAGWREAAQEELLQTIDDLLYTEETHLAAAARLQKVDTRCDVLANVLVASTAVAIVAGWTRIVSGLLALAAAAVSGVLTFMNPKRTAEQHLGAARLLAPLRVRAGQLLSFDLRRLPGDDLRKAFSDVARQKATIDAASPGTTGKDFAAARDNIRKGTSDRDR